MISGIVSYSFGADIDSGLALSVTAYAVPPPFTQGRLWCCAKLQTVQYTERCIEVRSLSVQQIVICITKISTFLILCDLAVCLATLYVSFSLVFALMRYLQGKVFLIRFYSPTTLSSSRAEFRLPSRLACA